jgi:hypothetical protein
LPAIDVPPCLENTIDTGFCALEAQGFQYLYTNFHRPSQGFQTAV